MQRTAFYAGSFDPLTNGHLDVIRGGLTIADRLIVAIGVHAGKKPLFTFDEKLQLIRSSLRDAKIDEEERVEVVAFDDLLIHAAERLGASLVLRGLRDGTDLDYEMQMAGMNGTMAPDLQTVFLPASPAFRTITATLVRQISAMGGDASPFVPRAVAAALREKYPVD